MSGNFPIIAESPIPLLLYDIIGSPNNKIPKYSKYVECVMQTVKDCGFNVVISGDYVTQMEMALEAIQNKGLDLKVIFTSAKLRQSVAMSLDILSRFINNPIVGGWEIMDEPKYYSWGNILYYLNNPDKVSAPGSAWEWNELTRGMNTVRSIDLSRMCYFNLAVTSSWNFLGGSDNYNQYLDILQTFYRPPVWSYDFYPFLTRTYTNPMAKYHGSLDDRYDEFFKWLDTFCENTKKTGRPFWAYCLCQVHEEGEGVNRVLFPVPSVGMLRFEAFNALAMGAQGIVYWRYGQSNEDFRYSSALDCEENPSDPYNPSLTRTKIWEAMKEVNEEILKYSRIFLGCEVIKYRRITGNGIIMSTFEIGCVEWVPNDKALLITEIDNSRRHYVVIVNSDPFNSVSYQIRIKANTRGNFLTGEPSSFWFLSSATVSERTVTRQLEPGDMDIIEWSK